MINNRALTQSTAVFAVDINKKGKTATSRKKGGFMKEYRKPTLALITFDAKDVLGGSASGFDIGWIGIIDNGENGGGN